MDTPRRTAHLVVTGGMSADERQARRRRTISSIARGAEDLTSVHETEYFTSSLLGQLWEGRASAPPLQGLDRDLIMGGALAEGLARHGGRGGRLVLHAIGRLAGGGLGALAVKLARQLDDELPAWSDDIGRSRVTAAVCATVPGDGASILLEVAGAGMVDHGVAVFIDDRRGGIAKHLGLVLAADQRPDDFARELGAAPVDVRDAAQMILDAVAITDGRPDAPVGETFAELRTLVIARAASALPRRPPPAGSN